MPQVNRVLRQKPVAPVVERHAELRWPRGRLEIPFHRMKPEIGAAHHDRRQLRILRRGDGAVAPFVGRIDPVVHAQSQVRDPRLVIHSRKTGINHLARIGLAVAVVVLHVKNVRRAGDQQSAFPRHQPAYRQNLIGENRVLFELAVAVGVFQHPYARARRLALGRVVGIVAHLSHVNAAVLIEGHLHRIGDVGLGREHFHMEVFAKLHRLDGLGRRQRFLGTLRRTRTGEIGKANSKTDAKAKVHCSFQYISGLSIPADPKRFSSVRVWR